MQFAQPYQVQTTLPYSPYDARGTAHPTQPSFTDNAAAAGVGALSVKILPQSATQKLGCRYDMDMLGIGARSTEEYAYGSSMALPIAGTKLGNSCGCLSVRPDTTGAKEFRHYYYLGEPSGATCPLLDPTKACSYGAPSFQPQSGCSYGFQRDSISYKSATDGNRFAQYRWG